MFHEPGPCQAPHCLGYTCVCITLKETLVFSSNYWDEMLDLLKNKYPWNTNAGRPELSLHWKQNFQSSQQRAIWWVIYIFSSKAMQQALCLQILNTLVHQYNHNHHNITTIITRCTQNHSTRKYTVVVVVIGNYFLISTQKHCQIIANGYIV